MLILGGHSCEYIGILNDYSQDEIHNGYSRNFARSQVCKE